MTSTAGSAIEGVHVIAGDKTTKTDAEGKYSLELPVGEETISFLENEHASVRRVVVVAAGGNNVVNVKLKARAAAADVDGAAGGTVSDPSGASLLFPAAALVDKDGATFTGLARVRMTYFNPANQDDVLASPVPLDKARMNGDSVLLETFGMVEVELEDETGNTLEVAEGSLVDVTFPVPEGLTEPPATIPLWHGIFDQWFHEGDATLDVENNVYRAQVAKFSTWNIDQPLSAACIKGKTVDDEGSPVAGAYIFAEGLDYTGFSSASSDANGEFCVAVRKNSKVRITAYGYDGVGMPREVESGDITTPIPPPCDDENICIDEGLWTVKGGTGGGGTTGGGTTTGGTGGSNAACGLLADIDPCLDGLMDIFLCWNPSGECNIDANGITWANGSKLTSESLFGPNGQLCGTISADAATETFQYKSPSNQAWAFKNLPNDDTQITCPNGTDVLVTPEQQGAASECNGLKGQSTSACTNDFTPGGTCASTSECGSGQVCCEFTDAVKVCVPQAGCPDN